MSNVNATDLDYWYWNCFNHTGSYILDYIMKFEDQFRLTKKCNDSSHITSGCITEPDDLYRIYVSSENDLKDILQGFSTFYDVDKFNKFSFLIRDLIDELTRKRWPERDPYEDDYYFTTDDNAIVDDDLSYFTCDSCEYVKPNSTEARMVIQWLILFKVCYNNTIDLEDIDDFNFAYDEVKKDFHLFIWLKDNTVSRHFVFENSSEKSILDISYWNEVEGLSKMKTFDLPLKTVVSEINKDEEDDTDTTDSAQDNGKSINKDGFGVIDSLALIKPTERKRDKRKKLLKMILMYQMMNNQK